MRLLSAIAVAGVMVAKAGPAAAQDRATLEKMTQLNTKALDAYDNLEFEEARRLLVQALDLAGVSGLDQHAIKARTHVHLGIVLVAGFKQRDLGVKQFKKAFEIKPDITLSKKLANPEIQSAFEEARSQVGGGGGAAPAARTPPPEEAPPVPEKPRDTPPDDITGLYHDLVADGYTGQPVEVKAAVGTDVQFATIWLAYRPKGANDFLAREMKKNAKGWYVAEIPAAATASDVVAYYIEVRDKTGKALQANGSAVEPNLVALGKAPPPKVSRKQAVDEEGEGEGKADEEEGEPSASADDEESSGDEDEDRPKKKKKKRPSDEEKEERTIFVALGLGVGAGWTQGSPELNPKDSAGNAVTIQPGLAPASLMHFAPEIGLYLDEGFTLSVQGRFQLIKGATTVYDTDPVCGGDRTTGKVGACKPVGGAFAALVKATWLFGDTKFHPYFNLALGGGQIRHVVNLAPADIPGCGVTLDADGKIDSSVPKGDCKDTVLAGAFLAGPGAGFWYDLSDSVAFTLGLNALVGVPNFTINGDVNAGLAIGM